MNFEVFGALVVYQNQIIVTDNRQCSAQHYRILDLNDDLNHEEIQTSTTILLLDIFNKEKSQMSVSQFLPHLLYISKVQPLKKLTSKTALQAISSSVDISKAV